MPAEKAFSIADIVAILKQYEVLERAGPHMQIAIFRIKEDCRLNTLSLME